MASYAVVETALARMHAANAETQRGALRGRLKHLQRLGLPFGNKPGKGKRIDYENDQIWQLAFALELEQLGIDPSTAVFVLQVFWVAHLSSEFKKIAADLPKAGEDRVLILGVAFMSKGWGDDGVSVNGIENLTWLRPGEQSFKQSVGRNRRSIAINISAMLRMIQEFVLQQEG